METVRIRRDGFAVRYTFQEFMDRYVWDFKAGNSPYQLLFTQYSYTVNAPRLHTRQHTTLSC